jgi:hypothetical protein
MQNRVLHILPILAAVSFGTGAIAAEPPAPTTAYGKCIKANGGTYDYRRKVWVPPSRAAAVAARDCLAKKH